MASRIDTTADTGHDHSERSNGSCGRTVPDCVPGAVKGIDSWSDSEPSCRTGPPSWVHLPPELLPSSSTAGPAKALVNAPAIERARSGESITKRISVFRRAERGSKLNEPTKICAR